MFHRTQCVSYKSTLSNEANVVNGVSQGSILGPLLFNLHFNDLHTYLKHINSVKYADDTVIYVAS